MRTPARIGVDKRRARIELLRRISVEFERKIGVLMLRLVLRVPNKSRGRKVHGSPEQFN